MLTVARVGTEHVGLHGGPARAVVVEALRHLKAQAAKDGKPWPAWVEVEDLRICPPGVEVAFLGIGGGGLICRVVQRP